MYRTSKIIPEPVSPALPRSRQNLDSSNVGPCNWRIVEEEIKEFLADITIQKNQTINLMLLSIDKIIFDLKNIMERQLGSLKKWYSQNQQLPKQMKEKYDCIKSKKINHRSQKEINDFYKQLRKHVEKQKLEIKNRTERQCSQIFRLVNQIKSDLSSFQNGQKFVHKLTLETRCSSQNESQKNDSQKSFPESSTLSILPICLSNDTTDIEVLYQEAFKFKTENQIERALNCYNIILETNKKQSEAYLCRGNIFYELNRIEEALKDYEQGLAISPNHSNLYCNQGIVYYTIGNYEQAQLSYTKSLMCDQKNTTSYFNRALVRKKLKKYEQAEEDYSKAIQLCPNDSSFYNNRAILYQQRKRWKEALADINEAIRLNDNKKLYYKNRAEIYRELDMNKEWESDIIRAKQLDQ